MGTLAAALDDALPQTQCTRCGYADCHSYASAIAAGEAEINRCPPGGTEGIGRLATLTGRPVVPLDPACGREGPLHVAVIDEGACIGCTRCLPACPMDCILGGPRSMHTVMAQWCTGCELCLPVCPVDCISLMPVSGERTGWQAWSADAALQSRARYAVHRARLDRDASQRDAAPAADSRHQETGPVEKVASAAGQTVTTDPIAASGETPIDSGSRTKSATIEQALRRAREARHGRP